MWHRWTEDAFWIWPQNIRGCIRYDVNYEKNNLLDPFWVYLSSVVICILIIINNFKVPHLFYNYSRCTKHSGKVTQLIMFIYIPTYIWILNVPTLILPFTKLMINMNLKKCDKNCWWNDTYKLCSPIVSKIHKKKLQQNILKCIQFLSKRYNFSSYCINALYFKKPKTRRKLSCHKCHKERETDTVTSFPLLCQS